MIEFLRTNLIKILVFSALHCSIIYSLSRLYIKSFNQYKDKDKALKNEDKEND